MSMLNFVTFLYSGKLSLCNNFTQMCLGNNFTQMCLGNNFTQMCTSMPGVMMYTDEWLYTSTEATEQSVSYH